MKLSEETLIHMASFPSGGSGPSDWTSGRIQSMAKEILSLREALVPFVKECDEWEGYDDDEILTESWLDGPNTSITVGDLRRAKSVLSE